jgi:hypothetical protein
LEAPFTTAGCPVKPGADATKPVSFTILTSRPRPTSASIAARAFSAQVRASSAPCSAVTSAPTLPVSDSLPSTSGSWPETYT